MTVPALPGLMTQGETREEAIATAREAIVFHLECLVEEGEMLPGTGGVVIDGIEVIE